MKKLLTTVTILGFAIVTVFSQSNPQKIKDIQTLASNYQSYLANFNTNGILDVEARFCLENWGLDSLDNFVKQSDGELLIESLGNSRFRISQDLVFGEGEDAQDVFVESYLRGTPDFQGDAEIDSSNLYFVMGNIKVLFSQTLYNYSGGLLITEESYTDYSLFGFPVGIVLSDRIFYHYDNNKFLTSEAYYSYSFIDQTVDYYDSTVYVNNGKGNPEESFYYVADFSGVLGLQNKDVYTYNSNDLLIKEETYYGSPNWVLSNRTTIEYLSKIQVSLEEETYDGGASWTPVDRDSTYFTENLSYGFYNRISSEWYEDGEWKYYGLIIATDCSGSYTDEIENMSFSASINDNDLFIFSEESINNSTIRLYNMNGQVILNNYYKVVPDKIMLNNLNSGVYFIEINDNNHRGIKKVIKI